jgi:hypothetical protein
MEHLKTPFEKCFVLCYTYNTKEVNKRLSGILDCFLADLIGFVCSFANWSEEADLVYGCDAMFDCKADQFW